MGQIFLPALQFSLSVTLHRPTYSFHLPPILHNYGNIQLPSSIYPLSLSLYSRRLFISAVKHVAESTSVVQCYYGQFIHSLVFSLEGRAWQKPEPSHVTGMALAHCILGKFLGVVCLCFPTPLDVPTLDARDPSSERW